MKNLISLFAVLLALLALTGCKSMADTAQTMSNDLGDEAKGGSVLVTRVAIKSSDPTSGGAPIGEALGIYGTFDSIPIKAQAGEIIKSYAKIEVIEEPSFFSSKVTKTRRAVFTFSSAEEAAQIKDAVVKYLDADAASSN